MIHVENLVKHYGATRAVDDITFDVPRGQVLGFLGPNGAGKTTTMKILTGFLFPDGGRAVINGEEVMERPLEARRHIGYLPETNPLYKEMNVAGYLGFAARMRDVPGVERREAIERVTHQCGLGPILGKDVGELSKGFRQRVGLAQAMIHNPEILILDEPTSGLDPNQIVEIRSLIKAIGRQRTVILSTHYLQEVEATCDRLLIIHRGKIVADGTIPELTAREKGGDMRLGVIGPENQVKSQLLELIGEGGVIPDAVEGQVQYYKLEGVPEGVTPETIFDLLVTRNGWKLVEMHRQAAHLETVFRRLTGGLEAVPVGAGEGGEL